MLFLDSLTIQQKMYLLIMLCAKFKSLQCHKWYDLSPPNRIILALAEISEVKSASCSTTWW